VPIPFVTKPICAKGFLWQFLICDKGLCDKVIVPKAVVSLTFVSSTAHDSCSFYSVDLRSNFKLKNVTGWHYLITPISIKWHIDLQVTVSRSGSSCSFYSVTFWSNLKIKKVTGCHLLITLSSDTSIWR